MEIIQFKYIDDVILRQPEVCLSTTTFDFEVIRSRINRVLNGQTKGQRKNIPVLYTCCMLLRNIYI